MMLNNRMQGQQFLCLLLVWALAIGASAQNTVQVISKKIEKDFSYRNGYEVNVEGERAEVIVESWEKNDINVLIEIYVKHPDKATAERDMEAVHYLADRVKNKIYLRNYLSVKEGTPKPVSIIYVKYTIRVPRECPVYLKNYFGTVNVNNLFSRLKINSEFSKIGLENIQGFMDVKTRFGDLSGQNLDGDMFVDARRSDVLLQDLKGRYDLKAMYGTIEIFAGKDIVDLNIDADKAKVILHTPNPALFGYAINVSQGDIQFPKGMNFNFLENTAELKKIQFKPNQEFYATFTIAVSFGDIFIGK